MSRDSAVILVLAVIAAAVGVMGLLVVLPLVMVLAAAFGKGFATWWAALSTPDAISALRLTLLTAAIAIPVNAVFGLFAAVPLYQAVVPFATPWPLIIAVLGSLVLGIALLLKSRKLR